jgi:hypothetical protein
LKHEESKIQRGCVTWFRFQYRSLKHALFAIPNGGKRDVITASIMKGEGVLPGVADIFLMVPNNEYHGLWIEMKTKSGRHSDSQKDFMGTCEKFGYKYVTCRSLEDFQSCIREYLSNSSILY